MKIVSAMIAEIRESETDLMLGYVRRIRVDQGYLFQISYGIDRNSWGEPTFVAEGQVWQENHHSDALSSIYSRLSTRLRSSLISKLEYLTSIVRSGGSSSST